MVARASQWGIYNTDGTPALLADSCVSVEVTKEFRVSDYPVEPGSFLSYDKVELPGTYRVQMSQGTNEQARATFLNALDTIISGVTLYNVNTPEKQYTSVTVDRYSYRRTAKNGVSLIVVELVLIQVRVVGQYSFSATSVKSPPAAAPVASIGQVTGTATSQVALVSGSSDLTDPFAGVLLNPPQGGGMVLGGG